MFEGELTLARGIGILAGGYFFYKGAQDTGESARIPVTLVMTGFGAFSGFLVSDYITGNLD